MVMATGGGNNPPSKTNPDISWIYAASLTWLELERYRQVRTLDPNRPPRLAIACRQEADKGTDIVIRSLPELVKRFPGVHLEVVGDGSALDAFKRLAASLNVSDLVSFSGWVDHAGVMERLSAADIFCYPTTASEGFPKVVLEALACGLPVVTTRVSVLPELVGERCGVLLESADPVELAAAVTVVLSDPEKYSFISQNAVSEAQKYSLEAWAEAIGEKLAQSWGALRRDA